MLWNGNSPYIYFFFFFQNAMFLCDLLRAKKPRIMAHQYLQWLQIRVLFSLFSVKSFIWEIWTKKTIQYSILKTLKRMITLWLCIILFMTVHTRTHTLKNCTDKQKKKHRSNHKSLLPLSCTIGAEFFRLSTLNVTSSLRHRSEIFYIGVTRPLRIWLLRAQHFAFRHNSETNAAVNAQTRRG